MAYDPTARTQKIDTDMYGNVREEKTRNGKKEGKFKKFIKNHKKLSIFIGLILLFALSLGGTILALNITNPPEVEMPNVVGLSKEEAQTEIENAKLVFEVEKEEYDKEVPEGFVISQDPIYMEKYNKVKQGSTVTVVISKGQEKTTVPKVVGMEKDEAVKTLEDAKLKVEIIEETSKKIEAGVVISQETEADSEAFAGDTVKIHVSIGTGIKQVNMINVVGKTEAEAKTALEDLGLKVNVSYAEATTNDGKVTKQSVEEGKQIDEGTSVTITVNKVAQIKNANVVINVKDLVGEDESSDGEEGNNTTTSTTSKTVNVTVKYSGKTETRTGISSTQQSVQIPISGKEGESTEVVVSINESQYNNNEEENFQLLFFKGFQFLFTFTLSASFVYCILKCLISFFN